MVTFGFKKRKALAQIPVLLGLLIMALVVPAATKLVQENQDSRNQAAGCTLEGDMVTRTGSCCSGLVKTECTVSYCLCTKPVATSTPRPVATSTPRPSSYTCTNLGGSCKSTGCACGTISGGTCQGEDECCKTNCPTATKVPTKIPTKIPTNTPKATAIPTKIPTSTPTRAPSPTPTTACSGTCQYSDCSIMNMKTGVGFCPPPQYCCGEKIIAPKCNIGDKYCATDKSGVWVCKTDRSGYTLINCSAGKKCDSVTEKCVSISTPTPTKRPTSTPTRAPSPTPTTACSGTCQYSDCLTVNMKTGVGFCPPPQYCCGEKIIVNKCTQGERYCSPDKKSLFVCKSDKSGYTKAACATGRICNETTRTCVALPTVTPTRAPSPTPTTACSGTCQYSDCLTMNMKTGVGFCPPPQYCCGEKIIAPKCNIGDKYCATDNSGVWVCKTDRSGYTVFKCSEGRVCDPNTRTCVSLSSTLTPTPTNVEKVVCSSKVIGRCGPEGGCAYGYRCLSGAGTFNCSYDPACGAFTATATPKPTATATPNPCSSSSNRANNCPCSYSNQCASDYCAGGTVCQAKPTPTPHTCGNSSNRANNCPCSYSNQCASGYCAGGAVCQAKPTPTPIDCLPGKKTCTGNKGMMECNSKGDGYNYFQCGILCVGGRCFGETITVGEPINPTNCISGEIKCEATSNGGFSEFKCNSSGFWDEILSCASGCYYGRCKQTTETEGCLKENERYEEGKCCPGLVKVTSPYGYYCGKPGTCTPGTTKCENNSIWKCDTSGYFSKIKSCDFGCGGNECNFGCFPKSTKCRNEQTLQVCSDDGTAWLSRSCNYCSEGICFSSKKEAEENLAYSDTGWDGEGPLPYCYAPSVEEIGLNTCPEGYVCGAQKVEDRNGLYYCEKKTVENSIVKVCVPNSSYCGQGGVLLRCSSDGMRWAAAWQCPTPRPEKGSQYNYSCKQVSTDRGECRPPTPEEGRDTAVEIVGMTAATVASVLALPAVITNPAIASTAFRVVRIGNAAYAINNAANECQSFESMTNDEKLKCALAAGYAVTSMVDAGLAGTGLINPTGSAFLSGVEVTNDVANLALGGVNAYNQCENGTDRDCYAALISAGIDLIALGVDVNQSKQWSQANLKIEAEDLPKTIIYSDEALTGTMFADDAAALSIYNKTYVSGGGQRLIIDPSRDQILAQTLVDSHTQINALRTSESISRVPLAQQYVTSLFPDYSRPTSTRASVNATVLIHDSIYEQFGETAFLGDFICSGSAVCREQSILLHTVLANEGKASQVVTGYLPAGKHAWVELIDSVTGQTMVVDSVWNFVKPQQEAYKIYGGVENLLRQTFVNP